MSNWPRPTYEVVTTFRAPLDFVYRWCTDYSAEDARLEKDTYVRRVLRRTRSTVVFEDLYELPNGWRWARDVVTLRPPDSWTMTSVGNFRDVEAEYRLTEVPGDRTRLTLRWRRRGTALGGPNRPKAVVDREGAQSWRNFAVALERDYRKSLSARRRNR